METSFHLLSTVERQGLFARRTIQQIPESNRRVHTRTGCSTRFLQLHCTARRPDQWRDATRTSTQPPRTPNKYVNRRLLHDDGDAPSPRLRSGRTSERRHAPYVGLYRALSVSSYSCGPLTTFRAEFVINLNIPAMMYRLRELEFARKHQISHGENISAVGT